jgi:hypothetical protein
MFRSFPRWTWIGIGAAVLAAGLLTVTDNGLSADWPRLADEVAEEDEFAVPLMEIRERTIARDQAIHELFAGQRTFWEVVDRFEAINATFPPTEAAVRKSYPGSSDREKVARQVLATAHYLLGNPPVPKRVAAVARMEAELKAFVEQQALDCCR